MANTYFLNVGIIIVPDFKYDQNGSKVQSAGEGVFTCGQVPDGYVLIFFVVPHPQPLSEAERGAVLPNLTIFTTCILCENLFKQFGR